MKKRKFWVTLKRVYKPAPLRTQRGLLVESAALSISVLDSRAIVGVHSGRKAALNTKEFI